MPDTLTDNFELTKISRRKGWADAMNNNLDRLGKLFCIDNEGNFWLVQNAIYDPDMDTWSQPDTSKASTAVRMNTDGTVTMLKCDAGSATITWQYAVLSVPIYGVVEPPTATVAVGSLTGLSDQLFRDTSSHGGAQNVWTTVFSAIMPDCGYTNREAYTISVYAYASNGSGSIAAVLALLVNGVEQDRFGSAYGGHYGTLSAYAGVGDIISLKLYDTDSNCSAGDITVTLVEAHLHAQTIPRARFTALCGYPEHAMVYPYAIATNTPGYTLSASILGNDFAIPGSPIYPAMPDSITISGGDISSGAEFEMTFGVFPPP